MQPVDATTASARDSIDMHMSANTTTTLADPPSIKRKHSDALTTAAGNADTKFAAAPSAQLQADLLTILKEYVHAGQTFVRVLWS